jgi:DNA polymerase-4
MGEQPCVGILYLDMNSYFASVEQQVEPGLRGRPVAVIPSDSENTCCIAASIEAKMRGVKTGTIVREARRLCPGIVLRPARHDLYVDFHHRIKAAVEWVATVATTHSIDEVS